MRGGERASKADDEDKFPERKTRTTSAEETGGLAQSNGRKEAIAELIARVRALVRRSYGDGTSIIEIGTLRIDTSDLIVWLFVV